ncbi:MAG: hypothetical protein V3R85_11515 [Alphaproteobacteria bacterium]
MGLTYTKRQREEYLKMSDGVGQRWVTLFRGDTEFYSAAYWDLFKALWRADAPVRKTDALANMRAIKSTHTAGKYIETALSRGLLVETPNPNDARSKLISLSDEMRARLDEFFDAAVDDVRRTARVVEEKGPVPVEA